MGCIDAILVMMNKSMIITELNAIVLGAWGSNECH